MDFESIPFITTSEGAQIPAPLALAEQLTLRQIVALGREDLGRGYEEAWLETATHEVPLSRLHEAYQLIAGAIGKHSAGQESSPAERRMLEEFTKRITKMIDNYVNSNCSFLVRTDGQKD